MRPALEEDEDVAGCQRLRNVGGSNVSRGAAIAAS